MTPLVLAYLVGALLGEFMLMAWWWRSVPPDQATARRYYSQRKGEAVLSGCLALAFCIAWAEGSLAKWLGWGVEATLGMSIVVGSVVTFFAHGLLALVGTKLGVKTPEEKP